MRGGPWPVHCVQGTPGAELYPTLERAGVNIVIDKGQDPTTEGYSGFEGTRLEEVLRDHGVEEIVVVGLATDYCVKNTALDALSRGFAVTVDRAGVRGVEVHEGDGARALEEVRSAGGNIS